MDMIYKKQKKYYEKNRDRIIEKQLKYDHEHKEHRKKYIKIYNKEHKDQINEYQKIYKKNRHQLIQVKLSNNLRSRLNKAIKIHSKTGSAVKDLGCTILELKIHLEKQFKEGMNWDNWSRTGWHIDHKKPLSKFDLTDRSQFLVAVHYTNLQPMWCIENIKKGDT